LVLYYIFPVSMVVLDGHFAFGCGPGTVYPEIHIFQCMLERTDAIMKEVLEPITFLVCLMVAYIYSTCVLEGPTDKMSFLAYLPPSDGYE